MFSGGVPADVAVSAVVCVLAVAAVHAVARVSIVAVFPAVNSVNYTGIFFKLIIFIKMQYFQLACNIAQHSATNPPQCYSGRLVVIQTSSRGYIHLKAATQCTLYYYESSRSLTHGTTKLAHLLHGVTTVA